MALSWNEIKKRAIEFSKEWQDEQREHAEAKSFWDDFFNVFGISRRRVASFEEPVKKLGDKQGFIDLFWKGQLIVEHKSKGRDLESAYAQALDYFTNIDEADLPKYVLVSDFERFKLHDLEEKKDYEFHLADLYKNIELFGFIAGYQKRTFKEENPVNVKAAEIMGTLHDKLYEVGYRGHELEVFLVRILFCLFADDTGIFEKGIFRDYIENKSSIDGSDLGIRLGFLFQILNTDFPNRHSNIDVDVNKFPYINGKLFAEQLNFPSFDSGMREAMIAACNFDWGKISPAVFGSMFQSVMDKEQRRNLGAHYTSEKNILKLIKPLFLDELWEEFKKVKHNRTKLDEFHQKIAKLNFLDPACGCGNFLVITYREIRLLELEILKIKHTGDQKALNIDIVIDSLVNVDQFHGIEIEEWAAKIAEVAMWLMDHQMNMMLSLEFGVYNPRIPLKKSANIVHGNALQVNWEEVVAKDRLSFILGNPPFVGQHYQNAEQKKDLRIVFSKLQGNGVLDFVSAWYELAARYIQSTKIEVAFVSTNSIFQGEQANILWEHIFTNYKLEFNFAHTTFQWNNEARGKAAVHVVIAGFSVNGRKEKYLYEYEDIKADPHVKKADRINQYLVDAPLIFVKNRPIPISPDLPKMIWGNKPTDGGHLIFSDETELNAFLDKEPNAKNWVRPYLSGGDFINGRQRYCLWLVNIPPHELRSLPLVMQRVEMVKQSRLESKAEITRKRASNPTLFVQISQPDSDYLAIPEVSSERRTYIPIAFLDKNIIASNKIQMVPNAKLIHFGLLTSLMHMTWVKYTAGRLKSDYSYSNSLVYNNFPSIKNLTQNDKETIEDKAQQVLNVRDKYIDSTLADLYDPLTMPPDLVKAHKELDKAVDKAYRSKPFSDERERIEFLFELYEEYTKAN